MKKLLALSLLATLSLSNVAKADFNLADGISSGAATVVSIVVNPAAGSVLYLKLVVADLATVSSLALTAGAAARKEIADKIKADVNEYNLSGELSPMLNEIVQAAQKSNADLSTEDVLSNITVEL